jgi:DNA-binding LytR/AlgR family response regulator
MNNTSGVEVGRFIREKMNNDTMHIVYISGKDSYAMELFDIRPLNFLIKPLSKEKINKAFNTALKLLKKGSQNFVYHIANTSYKRPIKDILYFESDNRKINIVTSSNTESFYGKMDNVYEQVKDYSFLYIHKSYLVNYNHVTSIAYDHLTMSNGVELAISQKRRKKIREMQLQFERNEISNDI